MRALALIVCTVVTCGRGAAGAQEVSLPPLLPPSGEPRVESLDYPDVATARARWLPMPGTAAISVLKRAGRAVLAMPCNFAGTRIERASWDLSVDLDLAACRGVQFQVYTPDASPVSHFSFYFRSGPGWYAASFAPSRKNAWSTVRIEKSATRIEGEPIGWGKIEAIRISAWRARDQDTRLYVADLSLLGSEAPIVVVRAESTALRDRNESRSIGMFCEMVARYLRELGLPFVVISDLDVTAKRLASKSVAILPHNPGMSERVTDELVAYVNRGGKLIAFYGLPNKLRAAIYVEGGRHIRQTAQGSFAAIRPTGDGLKGLPPVVEQRSWNIQEARPVDGKSRVMATWFNAEGQNTGHAAIVGSERGLVMTHVLRDDDPEHQRQLLLAMVGHCDPRAWHEALQHALTDVGRFGPFAGIAEAEAAIRSLATDAASRAALDDIRRCIATARGMGPGGEEVVRALALARGARDALIDLYCRIQKPLAGEHRAFWCHSAFGVAGMTWDEAIQNLAENGFTAILPNMLWGGTAYYESAVLPVAPEVKERGDQIATCLAACRKHGLACHVWKVNWNMSGRAPRDFVEKMKATGRTQVLFDGNPQIYWLCPSHPANQKLEIDAMVEVATKYDVDGIHFDYIRYPGSNGCFCGGCRQRFEAALGRKVAVWPKDVRHDDALREAWLAFRRAQITGVVAAVAKAARKVRPKVQISAAVFRNWPTDRDTIGQDWKLWCDRGYLDFVCPMDYTPHSNQFELAVENQLTWTGDVPCYPGIGLSTWPDRSDIAKVIEQITITRRLKTGGFTIFNYGVGEARDIVPACGKGITRKE
jgi:uncharacterized lipoprotein YddW (UPF0748 family)